MKNKWDGKWWAALERDDFTCQLCGKKGHPSVGKSAKGQIVVHHLDEIHDQENEEGGNHELDNLQSLCRPCHSLYRSIGLIKTKGKWKVKGDIFTKLGLSGSIEITD
jgi:5-methylcytosine-specific restriction endonuclease McrA